MQQAGLWSLECWQAGLLASAALLDSYPPPVHPSLLEPIAPLVAGRQWRRVSGALPRDVREGWLGFGWMHPPASARPLLI
jgi:hypothetical protein